MRKSTIYLLFVALSGVSFILLFSLYPIRTMRDHLDSLEEKRRVVQELELSDLCLFTEARYTRHISQADLHSPFQDHPMALEHFPSGSIVFPSALRISDHEVD
jgi:hypothetical protein